ncbi:methyl-accepting chemotaxis protein [Granulicella sibirica]|uniref:Methyl-accepting chemotaxis protein n=1 Tax=Granulicella sibirica TaxID=2479048 RepID=A0A4Q0T217_9BACT|nr:methyl-accepting chemotaxis protein [Granulicella sibirica]RXH56862.1 methyl-accepting chemotaxis protein [Granulicella sibirica]
MNLEAKLGLSSGVLVSAMLLSAIMADLSIRKADHLSETVTTKQVPLIMLMHEVGRELAESMQSLESYMLFGIDPKASRQFRESHRVSLERANQAILHFHEHLSDVTLLPEDRERLQKIEVGIGRLTQIGEEVESANESHTEAGTARAYDLIQNEVLALDDSMDKLVADLTDSQENIASQENLQLRRLHEDVVITLWLCTLLTALLGAAVAVLLITEITRSLRTLTDRANAIASGDLTGHDFLDVSNDQIGSLAIAMQEMQSSLSAIIGTTVETARTLTANADSMHQASDLIHHRIDEQSQQTQHAATAMHEMSTSIDEVSRHARSAADTARAAAQTARDGGAIVTEMLGSMAGIASAVDETSSSLGLLGEDSKRISQIVTVIEEIARMTNLLALNAAIEAARAGDHGRGFAVVAGEVRRLAESTAQATGEIAGMIRGIQGRTQAAIASMASGTAAVNQGVETTHRAGEALEGIIVMAERVDRMIAQIAIAATQQAAAANQSSASLHSIYSLSRENLGEMATTAAGVESLRATAVLLERHVVRFHLRPVAVSGEPGGSPTAAVERALLPA